MILCYSVENTASQNAGKLLYIRRYYIQLSHPVQRACRIDCVVHCVFCGTVYNSCTTLSGGMLWNFSLFNLHLFFVWFAFCFFLTACKPMLLFFCYFNLVFSSSGPIHGQNQVGRETHVYFAVCGQNQKPNTIQGWFKYIYLSIQYRETQVQLLVLDGCHIAFECKLMGI